MTGRAYLIRRAENGMYAVTVDDEPLFLAGWQRARRVARFLSDWQPTEDELTTFLLWQGDEAREYVARMRRVTLRWPAECVKCGQTIPAGGRASWDPETRVVVHGARCPLHVRTDAGEGRQEGTRP